MHEREVVERPIIMTHTSPLATLERRKTTTRRIIKPDWWRCLDPDDPEDLAKAVGMCPYGIAGDHLWVKEQWGLWDTDPKDGPENAQVFYRATDGERYSMRHQLWRSPIFMPRWASRMLLEVVGVRIERLRRITIDSAIAEGVSTDREMALATFEELWNKINARRGFGWKTNPWVFVIDYKLIGRLAPGDSHRV